jgi:hydroxypyruvate isomerase
MKVSANLGFLFREFSLLDAVHEAARAGFTAIECHWPYDTDPAALRAALDEHRLPLLAINTEVGNRERGDFGLAAIPERQAEARALIDQAVDYAAASAARNVHLMAGRASGTAAEATFIDNLHYAAERIGDREIGLLIEPLNHRDAPGYFLNSLEQAAAIVDAADMPRLRIMFDCYHLQIEGGDLLTRFKTHLARIGHVQIAALPDRGEPDIGEIDYRWLLPQFGFAGYDGWIGAEYRPRAGTLAGLGWLQSFAETWK